VCCNPGLSCHHREIVITLYKSVSLSCTIWCLTILNCDCRLYPMDVMYRVVPTNLHMPSFVRTFPILADSVSIVLCAFVVHVMNGSLTVVVIRLDVKRGYYQNCFVLDCVTVFTVNSTYI